MTFKNIELGPWDIKRNGITLKVGSRVIAAPMAGGLDPPYRMILHELGCPLSFTEMVSARAIAQGTKRTFEFFKWVPETGLSGAQIFGPDPEYLGKGAKEVERAGHALVDLNVGCPKRKVTRLGSGAAMMKDSDNLLRSVSSIMDNVKCPVGIKMRSGITSVDEVSLFDMVSDLEGAGISYLTMHPRTVEQQYSGKADRNLFQRLSSKLGIPVIASGDVRGPEDVVDYLHRGASAVMAARGHLGDPTWMSRCLSALDGTDWDPRYPSSEDEVKTHLGLAIKHFRECIRWYGEEKGCIEFRPHLSWYLKRFQGRRSYRNRLFSLHEKDEYLHFISEVDEEWSSIF